MHKEKNVLFLYSISTNNEDSTTKKTLNTPKEKEH